jgi:hypothetical protein
MRMQLKLQYVYMVLELDREIGNLMTENNGLGIDKELLGMQNDL